MLFPFLLIFEYAFFSAIMHKQMRMNIVFLAVIFIAGFAGLTFADSATQQVNITINAISELATSGNPGSLVITSATAGQDPTPVSDGTSNYSFSTNQTLRKITGQINSNMPAGTTLQIQLAAPGGSWSSSGIKALSTTPADLALGGRGWAPNKVITYTFSATTAPDPQLGSKTVTLTLTNQ